MGIFDGLFTSAADQEKEKRAKQRKAVREAERKISAIQDQSSMLEKEKNKLWNTAREQMLSGQKNAAASTLKIYKSKMVMAQKAERNLLLSQHILDRLTGARDMQQVTTALADLAAVMEVDPEAVQDTMDFLEDKTADVQDVSKIMDKAFERDMANLDREAENSADESDDALMKALMDEVNGSISMPDTLSANMDTPPAQKSDASDINAGRDALKKLMEGSK